MKKNQMHNNITWLGTLPEHWQALNLRQLLQPFSEKNHPELPLLSVVREKGIIIRDVESKEENHNYIPDDLSGYKMVKCGQFVVNKMKAWQGSYGVSEFDGIVSPAYFVFDINYNLNSKFFNKAIRSKVYVNYFGQASDGIRVGQWDLSMQKMKEIPFFLPPRFEQDQIVRFLDWKVSSINKLIAVKRKQIKELDEFKKAIINDVVIHGVNANVAMKDSGVDWLGKIPVHWKIIKLHKILRSFTEKNHSELSLLSVVREQGVIVRNIESKESNHNFIPDDLSGYKMVKKGQFVINKMKAWQGSYGVSEFDGIVSPAYFVFDINFSNLEYFHYAIRSKVYVNFFAQASDGIRVGQWDLSIQKMKKIPFITPSKEEQDQIVKYISKIFKEYEQTINLLQQEIKLLNDFKQRLISDVVTGKIDIRDIKIPDYEYIEEEIKETEDIDKEIMNIEKIATAIPLALDGGSR